MRKIRVIAGREYAAAVRSKAFLVTMLLMPVLMGTSGGLQYVFAKLESSKEKHYAVIDRSPGGHVGEFVKTAADILRKYVESNALKMDVPGSKFNIEILSPSETSPQAMNQQRFDVSERIEKGELDGLLEIGPDIYTIGPPVPDPKKVDDQSAVRIQLKSVAAQAFRRWAEKIVSDAVEIERLKKKNISPLDVKLAQTPIVFKSTALTRRDPRTGQLTDAPTETQFVNLFLPAVFILLMFVVIMIGATPAMHGVVEEKSLRIAEVLLGSATPFQIMAGKLVGIIGVALTMAGVYLAGGYYLAWHFGVADMVPVSLLLWFLIMLILALMIFGSLFIAIGAAASDIKDTQTLLMPVMIIACLPLFALGPIMQDPNGPIARISSFFPFATPMLLVARHAVPPGVPLGEMLAGIALVLATTWLCVWAAGRIFRVGILMQGKGPRFHDLIRWAIRG